MRLTIEREAFLNALAHVQSVVERRNTIPILANVLLQAQGSGLRLTATDLELEVVEDAPAMLEEEGATTVPAHLLHDIVRKLPEGSQLKLDEPEPGRVTITSGRARFTLSSLPAEEFPELAAVEPSNSFDISPEDLRFLIDRTRFAISTEETRYYLNGIYFHTTETDAGVALRAVATDGHRLARAEVSAPAGAEGMPGIIVPRKAVLELVRLMDAAKGAISVALSENTIRFAIDGVVLTSKLIDGKFPDYERVIPVDNDKRLEVDTKLFCQAVDRVSIVSSDKGRAVKFVIAPESLLLSVNNPDAGVAEEELPASFNGGEMEIGFNARYLLDIVGQFEGDTAIFELADSGSPTIIRDSAEERALYVLMPMRV